ncbi:hypothetical protein C8Q77DRAFT_1255173 [Trametes polyzona]|nr:hypothetical protein C8Q77DRAFT_1255173 [Trametes polyzona]
MGWVLMQRLAEVVHVAETDQTTGCCPGISRLVAWDFLISFSDEVQLIWSQSTRCARWMYAFIRFVPLLAEMYVALLPTRCVSFNDSRGFLAYFAVPPPAPGAQAKACTANTLASTAVLECIVVAVELILLARVHALYGRSRRVLAALLAGFAISVCMTLFGIYYAAKGLRFDEQCLISSSPRIMLLVWLSPIVFEAGLFMLTMAKFRESRREGLGRRPLLEAIVRDGTWAFVLALVVMVLNAVVYTVFEESFSGIFYFWAVSILSCIGSHLLLNLRRITDEPSLPSDALSAICFDDVSGALPSAPEASSEY